MSNNLTVGPLPFPKRLRAAAAPYFRLGVNADGVWVIQEATGRKGGFFRTRAAAIKYARDESSDGNFTIVYEPEGVEFGPVQIRKAA
jgi:hypothetical protein